MESGGREEKFSMRRSALVELRNATLVDPIRTTWSVDADKGAVARA